VKRVKIWLLHHNILIFGCFIGYQPDYFGLLNCGLSTVFVFALSGLSEQRRGILWGHYLMLAL